MLYTRSKVLILVPYVMELDVVELAQRGGMAMIRPRVHHLDLESETLYPFSHVQALLPRSLVGSEACRLLLLSDLRGGRQELATSTHTDSAATC